MGTSDVARPGRVPTSPATTAPAATNAARPAAPAPELPAGASPVSQDAFKRLAPDVASGKLSPQDAQLLATQASRRGVIGEAQAIGAARTAAALPPADRARFQQALGQAGSDTERAFLYKALAAGHPVADVARFADTIRGASDAQLLHDYTLSAPTAPEDKLQDGLAQQFEDSCVPTTAETLRGEMDPIYAGQVHARDANVHDQQPQVNNRAIREEQKQLLENVGDGHAVPVGRSGGAGTLDAKIDDVLNSVSRQTGLHYHQSVLDKDGRTPDAQEQLLDQMASQLHTGIPTPFEIRTPDDAHGHEAIAIAVEGDGDKQRFLVHDPYSGNTAWMGRKEFEWGSPAFENWDKFRLAGIARADEQLPPPPRTDEAR